MLTTNNWCVLCVLFSGAKDASDMKAKELQGELDRLLSELNAV